MVSLAVFSFSCLTVSLWLCEKTCLALRIWMAPSVVIGSHGGTEPQRDGLLWVAPVTNFSFVYVSVPLWLCERTCLAVGIAWPRR